MSDSAGARPLPSFQIGRPFLHPLFDVLLIGGGLSLILVPLAALATRGRSADSLLTFLPALFLISNSAHFAASTVRLYTKQDSFRTLPFLTMTFPLVSLAVASLAILFPEGLGRHLVALFLIWSPFHYSAQAYGLAVMYGYRSGARLTDRQKRLLRLACMMTFFKTAIGVPELGIGIWWLFPWTAVSESALARPVLDAAVAGLGVLAFGLPVALLLETRRAGSPMPLISLLIVITNAFWFFGFKYLNGLSWATVFHGVQYLAIVTIFHVKDRMRAPGNRRGVLYHTLWFYGASLALGYLIFRCWPSAYMLLGFGYVESSIMVVAVINLHHFIVDAYIWRLRKDPNYRNIAEATASEPAVAPVVV